MLGLSFEDWSVCDFRDLELLAEEWKKKHDMETARFRGLAAVMLSPYLEEKIALSEALPYVHEPEPEDEPNDAAVGMLLDSFFIDLKTRSKMRVKTGLA